MIDKNKQTFVGFIQMFYLHHHHLFSGIFPVLRALLYIYRAIMKGNIHNITTTLI